MHMNVKETEPAGSNRSLLTQKDVGVYNQIMHWAKAYLIVENPDVQRPYDAIGQKVCPFVEASLAKDAFHVAIHNEINGLSPVAIATLMLGYRGTFLQARPFRAGGKKHKALVVAFPKIADEDYEVLDVCQAMLKPDMVRNALMIGQFHPRCTMEGRHNTAWTRVSRSPVPLLAVRHMQIHDILFLASERSWFEVYDGLFGKEFSDPGRMRKAYLHLIPYYQAAREAFR